MYTDSLIDRDHKNNVFHNLLRLLVYSGQLSLMVALLERLIMTMKITTTNTDCDSKFYQTNMLRVMTMITYACS